jgi:ribose transport system substrate-binding protein
MLSTFASRVVRGAAALAVAASVLGVAHASQPAGGGGAGVGAKKKQYVIGLVAKSQSNPVFIAARTGAQDAARELSAKYGTNIRIDWRTPNNEDAQKQAEYMEQLAGQGVDGIAVSCSDAKTLTMAIDSTVDKGVPVVCFDSDAPASKRFAFYGTDDYECGKRVASELAKVMGEKGVVAVLAGNQTAPNLQTRVRGVKEEIAKHPGMSVLGVYYHKETAQDAVAKVEEVQRTNPQVSGWAMVGGWPLFTDHAMDNVKGKAHVVAVDALPQQLAYLKSGEVDLLLAQKVYDWGGESVRLLAEKLIENKTPSDPIVKADLVRVTKENAEEYGKNWEKWLKGAGEKK